MSEPAASPCASHAAIQSKATEGSVACPSCGAQSQAVMWELLEASCNPERAAQLASGQLLVHSCPQCGVLIPLDYPLFYVDRDRKVAAYYPANQGDLSALETFFAQAATRFKGVDLSSLRRQEFALRVVPQRHQLPEKVTAWSLGLDDELLEVFKASLLRELQAQNPELHLADLQLVGLAGANSIEDPDAKLEFVLFKREDGADEGSEVVPANAQIAMPVEAYRRLARSLEVRTQIDRKRSPIVDAAWAAEVLSAAEAGGR